MFWKSKCYSDGIDLEEAKNLKKIYEGCLQRAEDLEVFNDGQSQGLVQALIESELRADIQVNDAEDSDTDSSSLPTDDDGAEEEAGKLLVWLIAWDRGQFLTLCIFIHTLSYYVVFTTFCQL